MALITGANRGLGFEVSKLLLQQGWSIVAAARSWNKPASNAAAAALRLSAAASGQPIELLTLDVADNESIDVAVGSLRGKKLDALVNNAGIYVDAWSKDVFEATKTTNVRGAFRLAQKALAAKDLLAPDAAIVNVSSGYGQYNFLSTAYRGRITTCGSLDDLIGMPFILDDPLGREYVGAYKVSKACVIKGSQLLARELAASGSGVRVCSVSPGWCATDMGGAGAPRTPAQGARSIAAALELLRAGRVPSGAYVSEDGTAREP